MLWDIFCKVIDNFGDIGVCWRLSADLASRGQQVRLWVDDASALQWMAPDGVTGVEVKEWSSAFQSGAIPPGDILVEAFGCEVAPEFIANHSRSMWANGSKHHWINLEYLSAEPFVRRSHGLPSPVMRGPGAGLTKHFFYPGFTPGTGGLLREPDLLARQSAFDGDHWLAQMGIAPRKGRRISLFCYEPPALGDLLQDLASGPEPTHLLVTEGRAKTAVTACIHNKDRLSPTWNGHSLLSISYLPTFSQRDYDHLLWACDLNFVRGEDSLVRAIWAGKPFVWQIYPQHDDAHHAKLNAFLDVITAPPSLRQYSLAWNGVAARPLAGPGRLELHSWHQAAEANRHALLQMPDLTSQLLAFCI